MSGKAYTHDRSRATLRLRKGQSLLARGQLHAAAAPLRQIAHAGGAAAAKANYALAQLYYEWNALSEAATFLQQAALLREPDASATLAVAIQRLWARLHQIQGRPHTAETMMAQAIEFANRHHLSEQQRLNAANAAWLAMYRGNFQRSAEWIEQVGDATAVTHPDIFITLIQWHLTQHRHALVRTLLRSRPANQIRRRRSPHLVALLILESVTSGTNGLPIAVDALTLAQTERYVRSFLDCGPLILPTLQAAADHEDTAVYARHLLTHFQNQRSQPASPLPDTTTAPHTGTTPLSPQELTVLHLVTNKTPYQEIAEILDVPRETVRQHVRILHEKLAPPA